MPFLPQLCFATLARMYVRYLLTSLLPAKVVSCDIQFLTPSPENRDLFSLLLSGILLHFKLFLNPRTLFPPLM